MSLAINIDRVTRVLLSDGWHDVAKVPGGVGASPFEIDSYEFVTDGEVFLGGGSKPLIPARGFGFSFIEAGHSISGPLAAIQAVQEGRS